MTKDSASPPKSPERTSTGRSTADIRREREAEALRANLRKRKDQQRAREKPARGEPGESSEDPAASAYRTP